MRYIYHLPNMTCCMLKSSLKFSYCYKDDSMPNKQHPQYFSQNDKVERAIGNFANIERPTNCDLNHVSVIAQCQERLNDYRARAKDMTPEELEDEEHNSALLGRFMTTSGESRPHPLCDAHAIISGRHTGAARVRAVLAWFQRRIDDPINGCWLPRNTEAKLQIPSYLSNAVAHSRIHRKGYYRWLQNLVNLTTIQSEQGLEEILRMVKHHLQHSTFPCDVMLPAHKVCS